VALPRVDDWNLQGPSLSKEALIGQGTAIVVDRMLLMSLQIYVHLTPDQYFPALDICN
jgi:hypothetical protein